MTRQVLEDDFVGIPGRGNKSFPDLGPLPPLAMLVIKDEAREHNPPNILPNVLHMAQTDTIPHTPHDITYITSTSHAYTPYHTHMTSYKPYTHDMHTHHTQTSHNQTHITHIHTPHISYKHYIYHTHCTYITYMIYTCIHIIPHSH